MKTDIGKIWAAVQNGFYFSTCSPLSGIRAAICVCVFLFTSCEGFVQVDTPPSQLTSGEVFEDPATAHAAMTELYAKMRDAGILTGSPTGLSNALGNYADELDFYGAVTHAILPFYDNALLASNSTIAGWWSQSYTVIYAANALMEKVAISKGLLEEDKLQLTGEALFVRGLLHFYLVNLFGDIPYIKTTDYKENQQVGKETPSQVYAKILEDLNQAAESLSDEYIVSDRTRPNKAVVMAFMARVYLYNQQWQEASNAASYVLNQTSLYALESDLNQVFLKESASTLWQFVPRFDGQNTQEGETFIFTSTPPRLVALTEKLMQDFERGDQRKEHWTASVSDGENTWHYPFKYKERKNTDTAKEYPILFRLAELYLMRAEARAHFGDLVSAKDDLDKIRLRAGLETTSATSKDAILNAIMHERRVELFTETGYRFFDLKRTGRLDVTLSPVKPGWNTTDHLMPIPENELMLNPNLSPQNPGY